MLFTKDQEKAMYDQLEDILLGVSRGDDEEEQQLDSLALKHGTRIMYEAAMNRDMELDHVLMYDKESTNGR